MAVYILGVFWKARREFSKIEVLQASPSDPSAGSVQIIIPARDETKNIGRCLDSLANQGAERIVVVNDDSHDNTVSIARSKGADVVNAPALLPGFAGKPNACLAGAKDATAKWLLFVDADTWFEPGFLSSLIAHAEAERLDVISAILDQKSSGPVQLALGSHWLALIFTGVDIEAVHSIKLQQLLTFGHCILFRNDAYDFTGGHRTALRAACDDIGIARVVKRHRLRYEVLRAEKFGHVRASGWAAYCRTIFDFLNLNTSALTWQVVAAIFMTSAWGAMMWWLWYEEEMIAWAAFGLVPTIAALIWRFSILRALLAPVSIYLFALAALHSLFTHLFGISPVWKGRKL